MKHGCSIPEAAMLIFKQLFCEIESKKIIKRFYLLIFLLILQRIFALTTYLIILDISYS